MGPCPYHNMTILASLLTLIIIDIPHYCEWNINSYFVPQFIVPLSVWIEYTGCKIVFSISLFNIHIYKVAEISRQMIYLKKKTKMIFFF